jgi:hypothetical protein
MMSYHYFNFILGINVTMWVTIFLEMEYLDVFFYYAKRPPMEIFNILFSFTFIAFFHFWKFSNQKSIFEFGRISYEFLKLMDKCFSCKFPFFFDDFLIFFNTLYS